MSDGRYTSMHAHSHAEAEREGIHRFTEKEREREDLASDRQCSIEMEKQLLTKSKSAMGRGSTPERVNQVFE